MSKRSEQTTETTQITSQFNNDGKPKVSVLSVFFFGYRVIFGFSNTDVGIGFGFVTNCDIGSVFGIPTHDDCRPLQFEIAAYYNSPSNLRKHIQVSR